MSCSSLNSLPSSEVLNEIERKTGFSISLTPEGMATLAAVDPQLAKQYLKSVSSAFHAYVRNFGNVSVQKPVVSAVSDRVVSGKNHKARFEQIRSKLSWRGSARKSEAASSSQSLRSTVSTTSLESVVEQDGFCYLSLVKENFRDTVAQSFGPWPSLGKVMSLKGDCIDFSYARDLLLCGDGVAVHLRCDDGESVGDSAAAVFSSLATTMCVGDESLIPGSYGSYYRANPEGRVTRDWWSGIIVGGDLFGRRKTSVRSVCDSSSRGESSAERALRRLDRFSKSGAEVLSPTVVRLERNFIDRAIVVDFPDVQFVCDRSVHVTTDFEKGEVLTQLAYHSFHNLTDEGLRLFQQRYAAYPVSQTIVDWAVKKMMLEPEYRSIPCSWFVNGRKRVVSMAVEPLEY